MIENLVIEYFSTLFIQWLACLVIAESISLLLDLFRQATDYFCSQSEDQKFITRKYKSSFGN